MDTQDAGVNLIRSIAKLLSILSLLHISQSWTWWVQNFLFAFWHTSSLSNCSQVLFLSIPREMLTVKGFICPKVVWQNIMMLFWVDCLFFNWFYVVNRPQEFGSWSILTLSPLDRVMARLFVILSLKSVNETLWCYHLNESSLVELSLSAIYFLGFHRK